MNFKEFLNEAKKPAGEFIGKGTNGFSYAVRVKGVDGKRMAGDNFGEVMTLNKEMKSWSDLKTTHIGAKGKSTIPEVKKWVKENNPTQFFAKWKSDSSSYKDDSIEIKYID